MRIPPEAEMQIESKIQGSTRQTEATLNIYNRDLPRATVTLVTEKLRNQTVDSEAVQRPGQEATPRLEQGGPRWHEEPARQELAPRRRQSPEEALPRTEREKTAFSCRALLRWPTQELGDSLRASCQDRSRAVRARSGCEQAGQALARTWRRGCNEHRHGHSCGQEKKRLLGRTGPNVRHWRRAASGEAGKGHYRSQSRQHPQPSRGKRCPGLQRPRVWSRVGTVPSGDRTPGLSQPTSSYPPPGFRLQAWWA